MMDWTKLGSQGETTFAVQNPKEGGYSYYQSDAFTSMIKQARADVEPSSSKVYEDLGLLSPESSCSYDEKTGRMTFVSDKGTRLSAPLQKVANWLPDHNEFAWQWAITEEPAPWTEVSRKAKAFGEKQGFTPLTSPTVNTDLEGAWSLVMAAARISELGGVYSVAVGDNQRLFLAFGGLRVEGKA